jgi:hypothetical protein
MISQFDEFLNLIYGGFFAIWTYIATEAVEAVNIADEAKYSFS